MELSNKEMMAITSELHVFQTDFSACVRQNLSLWSQLSACEFRLFARLAQLEPVAALVKFQPHYDPQQKQLSFQYYVSTVEDIAERTVLPLNVDTWDIYQFCLTNALMAEGYMDVTADFRDYLEAQFPAVYHKLYCPRPEVHPARLLAAYR